MVATNSMATRSSLELMLDKLQQREDRPRDTPPALPVRPVSRARLPRARRPLQLDFNRGYDAKKEGSTESFRQEDAAQSNGVASEFDHFQKKVNLQIKLSENLKEVEEKGASKIQKCYRGHQVRCCYEELRGGTIALQSFIRGEIARRAYQYRSRSHKAITLIQKQIRKYFERRALQEHRSPFTQSKSGYLDQRHSNEAKHNLNSIPYTVLVELQKRVLRSEARVREKNEENLALKRQLEEMEKKWQQYEEKMKSMEKEWQDQFTYIQETLAAGKTNRNQNRDNFTATAGTPTSEIQINSVFQRESLRGEDELRHEQACLKFHPPAELRRLKRRFETWKKEYRNKLRDAQATSKRVGNSESAKRNWWGRLSS